LSLEQKLQHLPTYFTWTIFQYSLNYLSIL